MRKADNLPPYCAVVKKSGSLNFVDPSGPVTGQLYYIHKKRYQTYRELVMNMAHEIVLLIS